MFVVLVGSWANQVSLVQIVVIGAVETDEVFGIHLFHIGLSAMIGKVPNSFWKLMCDPGMTWTGRHHKADRTR